MPLRLDDDIVEGLADHFQVVRVAAADEAREIGALPDKIGTAHIDIEYRTRLAGPEIHMRMHQHAAQSARHRDLFHARIVDADGERQSAVQAWSDVVDMRGAAG